MSNHIYVAPVLMSNREVWLFKWNDNEWVPHRRLTYVIEGEIINEKSDLIGDTIIS